MLNLIPHQKNMLFPCSDSRWSTCLYLKTGDYISLNVARLFMIMKICRENPKICCTVIHVTPVAKITSAKPEHILPPACASIANRAMIQVPETLLAVNILTDILREIIKNYSFINFKPIQPPWDLSKRIISLNYFPKNSTNINICIYNQLYSSHSLYLYIYCCYCHILLNSVFSDLNVLYCIMTSWIYSFLEKTLIASLRHS